jgi:hypothetical protein
MSKPGVYLWQDAYRSAVLETDDVLMPTRIYEALAAIEQRLLSPIDAGCEEHRAIKDAQSGLLTLKAERAVQRSPTPLAEGNQSFVEP